MCFSLFSASNQIKNKKLLKIQSKKSRYIFMFKFENRMFVIFRNIGRFLFYCKSVFYDSQRYKGAVIVGKY